MQNTDTPLQSNNEGSQNQYHSNQQPVRQCSDAEKLMLVHHLSCEYHKSSDELLEDLKADLDPEEGQERRLSVQRMQSLNKSIQPGIEALQTLFKRGSFISAEDFRVTFEEVGEVVEGKWITPRPLKSRTTSFGRPEH